MNYSEFELKDMMSNKIRGYIASKILALKLLKHYFSITKINILPAEKLLNDNFLQNLDEY